MILGNLPVVRSRHTRLTCVADSDAAFERLFVNFKRFTLDAVRAIVDGTDSTVKRGVVVLKTSRDANHSRLDVGGDGDELALIVAIPDQTIERADTGDAERARSAESGARRSFTVRHQMKPDVRFAE